MKTLLPFVCVALATSTVAANPVYQVTAEHTYACSSSPSDGCKDFPKGFRFEAYNWGAGAPTVGGSPLAKEGDSGSPPHYRFDGRDVAPVLDDEGNMTEPNCRWPTGGVTQRVVEGPNGQLYVRRLQITTKCVGGRMVTVQRPLN